MTWSKAKPPSQPGSNGTGISFGLRGKKNLTAILILTEEFQMNNFGRSIVGESVAVHVGRGTDEGKVMVVPGEGDLEAKASMRGAVALRMAPWDLLPKSQNKAERGHFVRMEGGGVVIQLPQWCRPSWRESQAGKAQRAA